MRVAASSNDLSLAGRLGNSPLRLQADNARIVDEKFSFADLGVRLGRTEAPFAFDTKLRYASNISRFLHGSPAIPALFAARSGYRIINEIGVDKIREKSMRQTEYLIRLAEEAGFHVTSPKNVAQRAGTVTIAHEYAAAMAKELIRREFIIDYRPGAGIRISPHFYTKDEELELVIQEMKQIAASDAYQEAAGAAF